MKTTYSYFKRTCLFLALFCWLTPTNLMAEDTDVTWDSKSGKEFPSNSSDTKEGITLTTNMATQSGLGVRNGCGNGIDNGPVFNYESAPANNFIDITTDGKALKKVYVSIAHGGGEINDVSIAFSSADTYDGNNLATPSIITVYYGYTSCNEACEITAPAGAKSARIHRAAEGWGPYLHRIRVVATEATPCTHSVTVSYAKSGSETGSAPANRDICTDFTPSLTLPGQNTLVYDTKHSFVGWEKGGVTYSEGEIYTITSADISAGTIEFTAVWREVNVTDLTITDPVNNTIPLSWKIPGICDLSKATTASGKSDQYNGTNTTTEGNYYNAANGEVTAAGNSGSYGQYGVAFPIPNTTNVQTITVDWKGAANFSSKGVNLWAGILASDQTTYWECNEFYQPTNWEKQTFTINTKYWTDCPGNNYNDPAGTTVQYIGVFANAGGSGANDLSFSVREVRYSISGQADIDHIVLVRKAGSVPANASDGDVIYNGTKSHFTDTDVKTPGTTYYYSVFAVYSDASVSSPVYVSHTMETVDTYTVTYEKGEGVVTGEVPVDDTEYAATNSVTVAGKNTLARVGYTFAGWNDGSTTYNPNDSYTMPAHSVTFTAVWDPIVIPTVTNLTLDGTEKTVTLSWKIPGICDLSKATTASGKSDQYNGTNTTTEGNYYNAANGEVTAAGNSGSYGQYGVAFPIPNTTNVQTITVDWKGAANFSSKGVNLWAGILASDQTTYWECNEFYQPTNWEKQTFTINTKYWTDCPGNNYNDPAGTTVQYIGVFANAGVDGANDLSFSVREVRYHVAGREDIDHIVLVRKDGSAPADPTDGEVLHSGTKSAFVDDDASKVDGHTYYYKVFSIHADGSYSAPEAVSYTLPAAAALTTHTRTPLTIGDYGTVCFGYQVLAANIEGANMFEIDAWSEDGKTLTLSQLNPGDNMSAGRPYIYQATATTASWSYIEAGDPAIIDNHNGLMGSYAEAQITVNDDNYIIYDNKLYPVVQPARVGANRAYIHKTNATPSSAPRRRVTLSVNGTQTATDIDNISLPAGEGRGEASKFLRNGQLFIIRDGRTYNAQGIEITEY